MPRAKKVEEVKPVKVSKQASKKQVDLESESDNDSDMEESVVEIKRVNSVPTVVSKPSVYISNSNLKASDSDRIHLAQAINNFTLKSEQLIQEMKNFDSFRESVAKLDLLIDTKKQEYRETTESVEKSHQTQIKNLELEYMEKNKKLKSDYDELKKKMESDNSDLRKKIESELADRSKKLESEFADKKKVLTNTYEDAQIDIKRKIAEDKSKQCELYAKELKMKFVKEEEHKGLVDQVSKAVQDFTELKKSFDKQSDSVRAEELKKYQVLLKNETSTMDLTHRANNAGLQAQVEQQKKEIQVLQQTIEGMKAEIREQRELTKEVAQASSKAQITQSIGKN
jgi:hypothetical protein